MVMAEQHIVIVVIKAQKRKWWCLELVGLEPVL
jgi:hypothetical protein